MITFFWSIGIYRMWLHSYLNSRLDRAGHSLGLERGALDYGTAIRRALGGDPPELASNDEIRVWMRAGPGHFALESIQRDSLDKPRYYGFRERSWLLHKSMQQPRQLLHEWTLWLLHEWT
jgi:hypothetical protein